MANIGCSGVTPRRNSSPSFSDFLAYDFEIVGLLFALTCCKQGVKEKIILFLRLPNRKRVDLLL